MPGGRDTGLIVWNASSTWNIPAISLRELQVIPVDKRVLPRGSSLATVPSSSLTHTDNPRRQALFCLIPTSLLATLRTAVTCHRSTWSRTGRQVPTEPRRNVEVFGRRPDRGCGQSEACHTGEESCKILLFSEKFWKPWVSYPRTNRRPCSL
jgi:hypothetical protein